MRRCWRSRRTSTRSWRKWDERTKRSRRSRRSRSCSQWSSRTTIPEHEFLWKAPCLIFLSSVSYFLYNQEPKQYFSTTKNSKWENCLEPIDCWTFYVALFYAMAAFWTLFGQLFFIRYCVFWRYFGIYLLTKPQIKVNFQLFFFFLSVELLRRKCGFSQMNAFSDEGHSHRKVFPSINIY